jgi:hypothetical protein
MTELSTKVLPRLAGGVCGDASDVTEKELAARMLCVPGPVVTKAAADSMATDVTALTKIWTNPFPFPVLIRNIKISPAATLTAHAANYASVLFKTDDAANGTPATAATFQTTITSGTGDWAVDVAETPSSWTAANRVIPVGGNLFYEITKAASGVVVPAFVACVDLGKV